MSTKSQRDRERHLFIVREGSVKRFVITHVGFVGQRRLTFAQQGRNTYATRKEAEDTLELFRQPGGLEKVLTKSEMSTLAVREVDCYPGHFDPIRYYIDDPNEEG